MKRIWPWIHTYSSFRHTAKCPCELDNKQELNDTRLHNSPNFMGSDFFLWNKFKESTCWILICVRPPFAWFVGWINRCGATYLKSCWVLFIFVAIFASNTLLWFFHSLREFAYLFFFNSLKCSTPKWLIHRPIDSEYTYYYVRMFDEEQFPRII